MTNRHYSSHFKVTFLAFIVIFVFTSCAAKHQADFVPVRESDFRFGPVSLPLTEDSKKELNLFLIKGGDNSIEDYVDPKAPKRYEGLVDLLSDSEFLEDSRNFRLKKEKKTTKISKQLEQWLRSPIVYQIVDATKKRPPLINPISISDGTYWWVFYRTEDGDGGFKIFKLLVTLAVSREIKQ